MITARRPDKKQHSQYSQYSQSAPPAAAQQTSAVIQNFCAKKLPPGKAARRFYRRVMLSNLMTAGVCCLRWRDACVRIMRIMRRVLGASCYTPRVCLPLCRVARAKQNRRSDSCSSAPQIKPQYSQSAPPAAAQQTSAVIQTKKDPPRFAGQVFESEQKVLITRTEQPWRLQHV